MGMREDHERLERVRQSRLTFLEKFKALVKKEIAEKEIAGKEIAGEEIAEKEIAGEEKAEEVNASAFEFDRFGEFDSFEELQKSFEKEFPDLFESEEGSS